MKTTQYHKLFIPVYALGLVFVLIMVVKTGSEEPFLFVLIILLLGLLLIFYKLTISINDEYLSFSFGIGLIKKKYALSKIKKSIPLKGKFSIISRISFENLPGGGKAYVLSSALPSVEITYENKQGIIIIDRIGTDKPVEIADYINKRIGKFN